MAPIARLGKRVDQSEPLADQMSALGRLLCASSQDCSRLALIGALVRGIATQEGSLRLVGGEAGGRRAADPDQSELSLLDMVMQQQQIRRETRALDDSQAFGGELDGPLGGGAKRVAFTPRIGRR